MVQDGEQPRPEIGPLFPQMHFPEGSGEALLDEIVCGCEIARQNPGVACQTRDQVLDYLVHVLGALRLIRLIGMLFGRITAVVVFRSRVGSVQI